MSERKKNKLPVKVQRLLQLVSERLNLTNCAVAAEHKEAMKLYLDTWVKRPIDSILAYGEGDSVDLDSQLGHHRR